MYSKIAFIKSVAFVQRNRVWPQERHKAMSTISSIWRCLLLRSSCNHVTCSRKTIWFTLLGIYRAAVVCTVTAIRSSLTHFAICNLYLSGTSVRLALKTLCKCIGTSWKESTYAFESLYALKMEKASSSETWVPIYGNMHRRKAEYGNTSL